VAELILASASPRRRELLQRIGLTPRIVVPDLDELAVAASVPTSNPRAYAMRLAGAKAGAVAERLANEEDELVARPADERPVVLAADTIVVLDDEILNKPTDAGDARAMLRRLSGKSHTVLTGVAVWRAGKSPDAWLHAARTRLTFHPLSDDLIEGYVATGSPLDKAGAYGIQDHSSAMPMIASIDGDYWNVMGLPLLIVKEGLAAYGILCGAVPPPPAL